VTDEAARAEGERPPRGLLDTCAVIDLDRLQESELPLEIAISAVTIAELATGPHATEDPHERAARMERLQAAEATFDQIPFDAAAARAYGRVYAAIVAAGRKARGARALDMLIAATALANDLPLYTSNPEDFEGLTDVLDLISVTPASDAARRVLADREHFELDAGTLEQWEQINTRPARELAGLKRLMERPSPFPV
jgi:predicted nucleic acid-binding protein